MNFPIKDETIKAIEREGFALLRYVKYSAWEEMQFYFAKGGRTLASLTVSTEGPHFYFSNEVAFPSDYWECVTLERVDGMMESLGALRELIVGVFPKVRDILKAEGLEEAE